MVVVAREACSNCPHAAGMHAALTGHCRINGCPCERFTGAQPADEEPRPQRVFVDVPPGYGVQIVLTPPPVLAEASGD